LQQQQQVPSAGIYDIMSDAASMAAAAGSGTSHSPRLLCNNQTDATSINASASSSHGEFNWPKIVIIS
jgi:hypothetical protein